MPSSLSAALSGLQAHESWISVIGNNLANASTPGYKSSRAIFADQFSQTLRHATLPGSTVGGRNPMQLGQGVRLADIGRSFEQGSLSTTGRTFDLALNGRGHFMVSDGTNTFYTRVGTFGLDSSGSLVDQRTGYRVLGPTSQQIDLDTTSLFPPSATGSIAFSGNLPAQVTGPLAAVLGSSGPLEEGTPAVLDGSAGPSFAIPVGETWSMQISVDGGAPWTVSVPGQAAPYTATDIANLINALGQSGVVASDNGGMLQLTSARTGSSASLRVTAGPSGSDLAGLLGLPTSLVTGTETAATGATALNSLPTNLVDYQDGDRIEINGVDQDGTPVQASFLYGAGNDGTTIDDLVSFIDNAFQGATASFDAASGTIQVTASQTGVTNLSLSITNGTGVGNTDWPQHAFVTTTAGTGPDTVTTSIEVFDSAGTAHPVTLTYERQDDGSWNILPSAQGASVSGAVTGLRFQQNGSIASLPAPASFSIQFPGQSPQTVALDLGTAGGIDGVTQFGSAASVIAKSQDGYGAGQLGNMAVEGDGSIRGYYTNGQSRVLGELGVATFVNQEGLREVGDNLWLESANSGARTIGAGLSGPAGEVIGGALEGSNVEVAEEFVHLIEAQRGFQANARVVTTTDEVLAELVNLLR